ncbi:Hypothetical predicted protein [Cloeon dipterum]|nr:Hypothetical predicted protein [Cloeon dipterum]
MGSRNLNDPEPIYQNLIEAFDEVILNSLKPYSHPTQEIISNIFRLTPISCWDETKKRLFTLVDSECKFFHLGQLINVFPNMPHVEMEALHTVAVKASNLATLTIKYEEFYEPRNMREDLRWVIRQMRSLREMQIHSYSFTIKKLTKMCKNLHSLRFLDVKIFYQDPILFERDGNQSRRIFRENFVMSFVKLEIFKFTTLPKTKIGFIVGFDRALDFQCELTCFCSFLLPNLKEVGDPEIFVDMTPAVIDQYYISKLEFLSLSMNLPELFRFESFFKFPNVQALSIMFLNIEYFSVSDNLVPLNTLSSLKISTLCLIDLHSSSYLEFLLDVFGKNLKKLDLTLDRKKLKTFRMALILFTCPNLEELELKNLQSLDEDAVWSLQKFNKLKTLVLEVVTSYETNSAHFSDILSAPNLETLVLDGLSVRLEDLEIRKSMQSGENQSDVLKNLKKITVKFNSVADYFEEKRLLKSMRSLQLKIPPGGYSKIKIKNIPSGTLV